MCRRRSSSWRIPGGAYHSHCLLELALAAVDEDDPAFLNEAADLVYHLLVLLEARELNLADVAGVLRSRHYETAWHLAGTATQ